MDLNKWKKGIWVLLFFSLALNFGFAFTVFSWKYMLRFTPPPPPGPFSMGPGGMGPGGMGPGGMGPDGMGPGPFPIDRIIDTMDLSEEVRHQVKSILRKMKTDHRELMRQVFEEEKKALALIGKPGDLEVEMLAPVIESVSQIRTREAFEKARNIVEIRRLLGREKSIYLLSELQKEFKKRAPRDIPTD